MTYDAIGRVTRFDNPDETFRTTAHSPWEETSADENDNESGGDHEGTPTTTYLDPLGRPFLVRAHNGFDTQNPPEAIYFYTRTTLDIENQPLTVNDPLERDCQTHKFSIAGRLLFESNIDKGDRYTFADVNGAPIRRWDDRLQVFRFEYDELRRPTKLWDKIDTAAEVLLERRYYGEAASSPQNENLRGQLILVFDQAGKTKLGPFDFKGNLLESSRTLAQSYTSVIDWNASGVELGAEDDPAAAETAASGELEPETFTEERAYDALNRLVSLTTPDDSELIPTYNEASLLEAVDVKIRGASTATRFVRNIDYDAKGQRTSIEYGNTTTKVTTAYTYHQLTFRLTHLVTTRASDSKKLQDLSYTHDPVGNITAITDDADDDVFFVNTVVSASQSFTYDPLYRLISATGREHRAQGTSRSASTVRPSRTSRTRTTPPPSAPTWKSTSTTPSATSSSSSTTPDRARPPGPARTPTEVARRPTAWSRTASSVARRATPTTTTATSPRCRTCRRSTTRRSTR